MDVLARRTVGWQAGSIDSDLVLDAPEQAICARADAIGGVHRSDRGHQHLSIHYPERPVETIIGPYQTAGV